jgi:hypothetical protein
MRPTTVRFWCETTPCFISGAPPTKTGAHATTLAETRSAPALFLAGTASCRIEVSDVDTLFAELQSAGVLHDVSVAGVTTTDFGTREFATLDSDGNLLTFFRWNDT